jgi:5-methylcytosine-specific restriction endonuclease McrA
MRNRIVDNNYKNWRTSVYKRDSYCCQWPKCNKRGKINAHHIKRWADNPMLRYETNNGITLCYQHHKLVTGDEDAYAMMFFNIVRAKLIKKK